MLEVANSEHTNLLLVSNPKPAANHLAYRDGIPLKIGADFFNFKFAEHFKMVCTTTIVY